MLDRTEITVRFNTHAARVDHANRHRWKFDPIQQEPSATRRASLATRLATMTSRLPLHSTPRVATNKP